MTKNIYDFSQYQDNINFPQLAPNAELIILRVQAGSTHADTMYTNNVAGARANKIPFGTYAYAKFISTADAQIEARDCVSRVAKDSQFVVVDVEEVDCPANELVYATQAYIDYLHRNGIAKVGLYSGESFYKEHGLSAVKADFLWIANYGVNDGQAHNKPSISCDLWQFTDKSKVSGVVTSVDEDQLIGSKPLSYFTGIAPAPKPQPAPVAPKPTTYTVASGDTLSGIAVKTGVSQANLEAWNGITDPNLIQVGHVLRLTAPTVAPIPVASGWTLPTGVYRSGVQGAGVKEIQSALNHLHFNCGIVDGKFGGGTADALHRFQIMYVPSRHDGVYDSATRSAMLNQLNK